MTELMTRMTFWLIAAMALGFIVAWFLSRTIYKKKQGYAKDTFLAVIFERNNMIDNLEKNFQNERTIFEKLSDELKDAKEALTEKTSLLTTLQNRLNNSSSNENASLELKERSSLLLAKVQKLEQIDMKRVKELEDFEEIVLLAEEKVEESEEKVEESEEKFRQIVKKLDDDIEILMLENKKAIRDLEEQLRLYAADSSEPEFIISKDQFIKIEEQLKKYQKEIESLNNENKKLHLKSKKSFTRLLKESDFLENKAVDELKKESDDGSMVKVFRETYRKITNS